ncbi:bifunctional riboflavin kinase/FAD synthetase [Rhodothermus marinus]|uniref:bifunctional riboflavin kinase/FAD synthetase n=1 Tax=Rhodothermus marinus TaxID=29549 RepID=UPI0012BA3A54|nr:bifunctional riboflavin kinase/FAD synthetase [Rhodothermus marinus]BBM69531.1 riboflavin biosynthesis protein [Rhodothermus marinus]BBM72513.1 riboflavin biosynthesis protein [Rhodothermus marinus]
MKFERGLEQVEYDARSVVTVGTFDGVHRGHQAVLQFLMARARERDGISTVLSFDPHPREVLRGEPVPLLTTVEERATLLEALGIERFIVLSFTPELAAMPARQFVEEILVRRIGLQAICVGYDHTFGRNREGNVALLQQLGPQYGFAVDVIPPQVVGDRTVSSTLIRTILLRDGDVRQAADLLGRPYMLQATVVRGDGRGRVLGFPTANLHPNHPRKLVPRNGVYAVRVWLPGEAEPRGGMMNIGMRPTFAGDRRTLEVHVLDFEGDLYGQLLRVDFIERLRDEQRFPSVEALREQLFRDRQRCMEVLQASV